MKPMLADKFTPEQAKTLGEEWVLENKYDGVRGYIEGGQLFDRRGANITHKFPEFTGLGTIKGTIDGEIVARTGKFNDVSGRVHLKDAFVIKLAAQKAPAAFVAFDIVTPDVLEVRRRTLLQAAQTFPEWLTVTPQFPASEFPQLWGAILKAGDEGLMAKKKGTLYEHRRSSSWRKVKNFYECTAVFTKMDKHTHGVRLETSDGKSVNVNGVQAIEVERIFNALGEVSGEIQYMVQLESDAWRFPSWRGLAK